MPTLSKICSCFAIFCLASAGCHQTGCQSAGGEPTSQEIEEALPGDQVSVKTIISNLQAPWDVTFTSNGRVFLTERDRGRVSEIVDGALSETRSFPIDNTSEAGLLGIAASPDFEQDHLLYVYLTTDDDNRVLRFSTETSEPPQEVITAIPAANIHNGGRLLFGPDDKLYISTGDAGNPDLSQDPQSLAGKILRLNPDGTIPDDNPFEDSPVYALGFRNVQGLAFDDKGQLYCASFGPNRDDEINRVEAGKNYGWPHVTGKAEHADFQDPIFVRQPPQASWSGLTFLNDGAIETWEGDLFAAGLRGNRIWRLSLSDDGRSVTESEDLFVNLWGRLRHITQAPDGSLWVLTNNRDGRGRPAEADDRIYRIGP